MNGTIATLRLDKGFGFIRNGDTDYFFHRSNVASGLFEDLRAGDSVVFNMFGSSKRRRAERVRPTQAESVDRYGIL